MNLWDATRSLLLLLLCASSTYVQCSNLRGHRQLADVNEASGGDRAAVSAKGFTAALAAVDDAEKQNLAVDKTTLVLPVTRRDFERFLVMLASLHRFLDGTLVSEMVLLVRGDEVEAWQKISALPSPFPVRVVGEESLVNYKWSKYKLQMMLKLLVSLQVTTRYYFVLDADLILRKPFGRAQLLCEDGRAPYNPEPVEVHPNWWQASYDTLSMDSPDCMKVGAFGVTPTMLSTATSRAVVAWLDAVHGRNWTHSLQHGGPSEGGLWTEYTMYGLVGCATGNFAKTHGCMRVFYTGIWTPAQVRPGAPALWSYLVNSAPEDPPFVVLQEEAGVPLADVVEAAKMMLAEAIASNAQGGSEPVLAQLLQDASASAARNAQ